MASNGGPVEEAGKVAGNIVTQLGTQPHMLLMILLNLGLVSAGLYLTLDVVEKRNEQLLLVMQRCLPDALPRYDLQPPAGKGDRAH